MIEMDETIIKNLCWFNVVTYRRRQKYEFSVEPVRLKKDETVNIWKTQLEKLPLVVRRAAMDPSHPSRTYKSSLIYCLPKSYPKMSDHSTCVHRPRLHLAAVNRPLGPQVLPVSVLSNRKRVA